jgi:hypothetical protein
MGKDQTPDANVAIGDLIPAQDPGEIQVRVRVDSTKVFDVPLASILLLAHKLVRSSPEVGKETLMEREPDTLKTFFLSSLPCLGPALFLVLQQGRTMFGSSWLQPDLEEDLSWHFTEDDITVVRKHMQVEHFAHFAHFAH